MAPASASRVTPFEHTIIGAVGGVMEVCLMQPMVAFKNALQEGRPMPTAPKALYRGLLINAASIAPITASQFGTHRILEQALIKASGGKEPTSLGRFGCAAGAGAVSAMICTPTELIIIQQQKKGTSLMHEVKDFFRQYPAHAAWRGLVPCLGRETLYAAGYLGLCPILYDYLKGNPALKEYPSGTAMMAAGVAGGVFAAAASHPFDTIKTRMQAYMYSRPEYSTTWTAAKTIYNEGGILKFWSGLTPRMTRIIAATFILTNVRTMAVQYIDERRVPAVAPQPQADVLVLERL
eukprot:jgi/Chrzof1/13047/Cz07g17260.t1